MTCEEDNCFYFVESSMTEDLPDGDARLAWEEPKAKWAFQHSVTDCGMSFTTFKSRPWCLDPWFGDNKSKIDRYWISNLWFGPHHPQYQQYPLRLWESYWEIGEWDQQQFNWPGEAE
jgi:hypothetical protein